jgi:hypothetical protein
MDMRIDEAKRRHDASAAPDRRHHPSTTITLAARNNSRSRRSCSQEASSTALSTEDVASYVRVVEKLSGELGAMLQDLVGHAEGVRAYLRESSAAAAPP